MEFIKSVQGILTSKGLLSKEDCEAEDGVWGEKTKLAWRGLCRATPNALKDSKKNPSPSGPIWILNMISDFQKEDETEGETEDEKTSEDNNEKTSETTKKVAKTTKKVKPVKGKKRKVTGSVDPRKVKRSKRKKNK